MKTYLDSYDFKTYVIDDYISATARDNFSLGHSQTDSKKNKIDSES